VVKRYGTSDVLMVMLHCRGVDIMEVDTQGRDIQHYARDSWRMNDQEKKEIEEIIALEKRSRLRKDGKEAVAAKPEIDSNEVIVLREKMNRMLDDLHQNLQKEDQDLRINWRMETNRLTKKHETETGNLDTKHDRDELDMETKFQKTKNDLHTRYSKESYELKMKQERELEGMMERHTQEKTRREKDKNSKISKYMHVLQEQDDLVSKADIEIKGLAENLRKETECPVCLQEMMGRVWQCMAGHIICEVCHDRREVTCCPTCRSGFIGRAIAFEKMLKTIRENS